jgi:hypothetical protein
MVNPEERAICERRGHEIRHLDNTKWAQCSRCFMWHRSVPVKEERADVPPENEIYSLGKPEPRPVDAAELAICRTRNHKFDGAMYADEMWRRCIWCRSWVRLVETAEYRLDDPPMEQMDLPAKLERRTAESY